MLRTCPGQSPDGSRLAALIAVVGVAHAVSIAMHNRKCDQLNNQKKEVENRIAELNGQEQGALLPSAPQ